MKDRPDPHAVAAWHFFADPDAPSRIEDRLRLAVNAALITDRKRTLAYWLCRWRQKVVWFGGWEHPNCGGFEIRRNGRIADPTPLRIASCFTHFGDWWHLKLPRTILVWSRDNAVYLSPDGTPRNATRWLIGKEYGA
ncbi:MAG: hypothetical protein EOP39_04380 [Rubrivivax sp.]|nr:MAG: hypothetical protein EOP39_04380 [Rubrivivax sp.]